MRTAAFALLVSTASPIAVASAGGDDTATHGVRGVIRAEASATISSELVARIAEMPFRAGEFFRAGDVLIRFDCARYAAELKALLADVRAQEIAVENQRILIKHRATGANDLALSEAKVEQASSNADALRVRIAQCQIHAPYDGHVIERLADVFEMPQSNSPLLKVAKHGNLEVELIVPSVWAARLKRGDAFRFEIDETASVHEARILLPAAVVDPVSRTLKMTARLLDAPDAARPGMSGTAQFDNFESVGR